MTTDEEEKAHSITAIWNFENKIIFKMCNVSSKASVFMLFAPAGTIAFNQYGCSSFMPILNLHVTGQCLKIRHWLSKNFEFVFDF